MSITKKQFARIVGKSSGKAAKVRKTPMIDHGWLGTQGAISDYLTAMGLETYFTPEVLPIRINTHEHHMVTMRRNRSHRQRGYTIGLTARDAIPCVVTFIRYSCQTADDDNLSSAYKALRDGIADAFGVSDAPGGPIEWRYEQVKTKRGQNGLRVNFQRKL